MKKLIAFLFAALAFCGSAHAIDCTTTVANTFTYAGVNPTYTLVTTNDGGSFYINQSDLNYQALVGSVQTSRSTGNTVIIRYSGASACNTTFRTDLTGIFLY